MRVDLIRDRHAVEHVPVSVDGLTLELPFAEDAVRVPQVGAGDGVLHRVLIQQQGDALSIRTGFAPFHHRGQLRIPLRAIRERFLEPGGGVAQDIAERGVRLRKVRAVLPNWIVEVKLSPFDALQKHDGSEGRTQVSDKIWRIRSRADARRSILVPVAFFPNDDAVTNDGRRHAGNSRLLSKRLEIVIEDRERTKRGEDRRLLRCGNSRSQHDQENDRRRTLPHHRMKVNFARPTTSSACHGQTNDMMRGVVCARMRT